jgi:hypothetical protein
MLHAPRSFDTDVTKPILTAKAASSCANLLFQRRRAGSPLPTCVDACDLALAFDQDVGIANWEYRPKAVAGRVAFDRFVMHVPDFLVVRVDGTRFVADYDGIVGFEPLDPTLDYLDASMTELLADDAIRLRRGIAAYADHVVPLASRIRLLALLATQGSTRLTEACEAASCPLDDLLAMAARCIVVLDVGEGPIDHDAIVRPARSTRSRFSSRRLRAAI